jgi:hypothetical protein
MILSPMLLTLDDLVAANANNAQQNDAYFLKGGGLTGSENRPRTYRVTPCHGLAPSWPSWWIAPADAAGQQWTPHLRDLRG